MDVPVCVIQMKAHTYNNIADLTGVSGRKGIAMKKYYALYTESNDVLVFDSAAERDEFVADERVVHPECVRASAERVKHLIEGKEPIYAEGFGCMAILS